MRVLVHDYSGHPFQVQLSRALARMGHAVQHLYSHFFQTPHGALLKTADDPPGFEVDGIDLDEPFQKYAFYRRRQQERIYGRLLAERAIAFGPDVVLSSNTPLDAQAILQQRCRASNIPFVFWVQDLYGVAIDRLLRRRLPLVGALIGHVYKSLEWRLLRHSQAVVAITDDFLPLLEVHGVPRRRVSVIENWAPIAELPLRPRDNDWAREHELIGKRTILYAGTLGLKHDPELLVELAGQLRNQKDITVVVVSEGPGADYLKAAKARDRLDNLAVFGFEPYERLPDVLAAADVLVAILETDASVFSVPSKVLSYLCAGRPILAAIPEENLAARIIVRTEAGTVVPPNEVEAVIRAAKTLLTDGERRRRQGANARNYAIRTFNIDVIASRFENVLNRALG